MKRRTNAVAAAEPRRGRFVGPLLAANVVVVGITITLLTVGGLRAAQRDNAERAMTQRTDVAGAAVITETARYQTLLQTVAAGLGANDHLTAADFDAATAPMATSGLLGATSVAFVVPAGATRIAETQAFWRARGAGGLVLDPRGDVPEHLFSILSRPLNGSGPKLSGLDLTGSPEAAAALNVSRRSHTPTVSDTYVLLRDRITGAPPQLSFVFVAPVLTPGYSRTLIGWMVLGVHGQSFLDGVLGISQEDQLDGELLATNGDGRQVKVAGHVAARGELDLSRQTTIQVANRKWSLVTRANSANLPGGRSNSPLFVLFGGIAATLMLAGLVYVLATGRSRAREQVLVKTADLRTAEAESRRQAGLLGAIMASIGDGVGVVDANGTFLLHNPAALALLGATGDEVNGPDDWQQHFGLFRPDGHAPFPIADMPLMRALRGESSDNVEMLIRNPARPDGILVSVDGRPLDPSAGQHGAVAVFHDITELRQYETDLAVFAGVVAHDLKAPLAVIRGHCETAADELSDAPSLPAVDQTRAALLRITVGVDRMAGLIDTLLAYTTAKDAPLRLRGVALDEVVGDVVTERTAHPGRGGIAPEIYVGPLPEVRADPAMLRHVVDNLIGNAMKYVQAGRAARIDVTTGRAGPGWTRVEIADRGIGIPDADKPNIFESFHRAHRDAGYAGTGLGLAICRRIVERHGGVIGVADNPGGGTRFHFTLPLSPPPQIEAPAPAAADPPPAVPAAPARPPVRSPAEPETDSEAYDRAALNRALAGRAAMERSALPGMFALPADSPSARGRAAARVRAPVPDHQHGT